MTISAVERVRRRNAGLQRPDVSFFFVFEASFVFLLVLSGSRDDVFALAGEAIEENSWPLLLTQR